MMNNSKGSLILKGLSPGADEEQLVAYLRQRAKSISPEKIPDLLRNLPVVLSRNVAATTGTQAVQKLRELGADALFLPGQDGDASLLAPTSSVVEPTGHPPVELPGQRRSPWLRLLYRINKELWIILAMLAIALLLNYSIASRYLLLGFYTLPAVLSAYLFGRRQAVLTALASILLVVLISHFNPGHFESFNLAGLGGDNRWYHIVSWGCILMVTAYTMGTLHERDKKKMRELRRTYQGLLLILRRFIAQDEERENHCYRVAIYATRIAAHMELEKDEIEDIRSAALLHDLANLRISRSTLYRAARFSAEESGPGGDTPSDDNPLCGPMGRILPMVLGQQAAADRPIVDAAPIPLGTHILAVADAYDTLTTGGSGHSPLTPQEARQIIGDNVGSVYDPEVVRAFTIAFDRLEMELPAIML